MFVVRLIIMFIMCSFIWLLMVDLVVGLCGVGGEEIVWFVFGVFM